MSKIWFTGDKHHNHINILKYDNRPFASIEQMNEKLILNHNEMVKNDDICYDLGDFSFKGGYQAGKQPYTYFLNQYSGRYVIIRGNHEKSNRAVDAIVSATIRISNLDVYCIHDPMYSKVEYELNLCAHVHNWFKEMELQENGKKSLIINVGVTQWAYRPVEWEKIYAIYMRWKKGLITPEIFDKKSLAQHRQNRKR
jgi:calcineurin-like phosphoesterase family protein